MKVVGIYSLDEARQKLRSGELADNWVVSITDLADEFVVGGCCRGVLRVKFDDILEPWRERKLATAADIRRILDWCRDKDDIVVHCQAGASRSAAVAYLIECLQATPKEALGILDANQHSPNMHIVRLGAKILRNPEIATEVEQWLKCNGYDFSAKY